MNIDVSRTNSLLRLLPLAKQRKGLLILTIIAGVVSHMTAVAAIGTGALVVGQAITGASLSDMRAVVWLLSGLVLLTGATRWWQAHVAHDLAFSLIEVLQLGIYDGLERSAPGFILGHRTGEFANIANNDAQLMEFFFAHTLGDYIAAIVVPLGAITAMAFVQPWVALALLPFVPLLMSVPFWLARRAGEQGRAASMALGALNADVVEAIQCHRDLSLFDQNATYASRIALRTTTVAKQQRLYASRSGLEQAAIDLIIAFAVLTAAGISGLLYSNGLMELKFVPLALLLAGAALAPVIDVTQTARKLGELRAAAERILAITHQAPNVIDDGSAPTPSASTLRFDKVSFSYAGAHDAALHDVSFSVHRGQILALIGHSGAGKSSCAHLIMRFWDPASGVISIGGTDIATLPIATLRQLVTIVPQDVHLFDESIADNIRLARRDATHDQVEHVARLAQAHDFITALPQGYDTRCGEKGLNLSGGQRQRIAIARALLHGAPILILDEAVSQLDGENEHALHAVLKEIRHSHIIILIAHQPSTIATADQLLALDGGTVVEHGTLELLMKRDSASSRIAATFDGLPAMIGPVA